MKKTFKRTAKQVEQTKVLSGPEKHILFYGGSRASKTFGIVRALIIRASKIKSRHLATRLRFNHAKTSLWYETFPKVFNLCFPNLDVDENKSDWFYRLPNGSEIWIGGLDEKKRVEKILGKEYSSIFFNECSQIPYSSVTMALTRLAELNSLKKKAYYDCNPPTKKHWTYPLFIKGLDPEIWEPKKDAKNYTAMLMNPHDNLENIDPEYLEMLEALPEKDRKRFLLGEFTDESEGLIYYAFDRENHVGEINLDHLPITVGMDFNVNPGTAVICKLTNDSVYVMDEIWLENTNTPQMAEVIKAKYPGRYNLIPDSTGNKRSTSAPMAAQSDIEQLKPHFNIPNVVNPFRVDRYNNVNNLFEKNRIKIHPRCVKLIRDLQQVSYKEGTNLPDTTDKTLGHITDALGYVVSWAFPIVKIETGVESLPR